MQIRTATEADLPQIIALKIRMFEEAGLGRLLAPNARDLILRDYCDMYAAGTAKHFLACSREPVAVAGAFLKSDIPFKYFVKPVYGFIGDVYTRPALRGRGFAKQLNQLALEWLCSQGVTMVRLLASEAGRPLYDKLGFKSSDEMVLVQAG